MHNGLSYKKAVSEKRRGCVRTMAALRNASVASWYYLRSTDNKPMGPYTSDALIASLQSSLSTAGCDVYVWREGMPSWQRAKDTPELFRDGQWVGDTIKKHATNMVMAKPQNMNQDAEAYSIAAMTYDPSTEIENEQSIIMGNERRQNNTASANVQQQNSDTTSSRDNRKDSEVSDINGNTSSKQGSNTPTTTSVYVTGVPDDADGHEVRLRLIHSRQLNECILLRCVSLLLTSCHVRLSSCLTKCHYYCHIFSVNALFDVQKPMYSCTRCSPSAASYKEMMRMNADTKSSSIRMRSQEW